jgi:hypothetical protein
MLDKLNRLKKEAAMKTYETLVNNLCDHDWEDLTNDEKNNVKQNIKGLYLIF